MTVIIGIAGFGGAGKTSVSNCFVQSHGFKKVSFAQPLKDALIRFGATREDLADPVKKLEPLGAFHGKSLVQMMESLGSWGRDHHPDFWVSMIYNEIRTNGQGFVIIDDIRFQNEANMVNQLGGKVYRINRVGLEPSRPSDFVCRGLTGVVDLENDPTKTSITSLYQRIYNEIFSARS